jgi:hypothetical protein
MKMLRENSVLRVMWFLLAMHTLNCAAQKPDMQLRNLPLDLEVNQMENIVEVVVDMVMEMVANETPCDDQHAEHNYQLNNDIDFTDYCSVLKYTLKTASHSKQENTHYTKRFPEDIVADYLVPPPRA